MPSQPVVRQKGNTNQPAGQVARKGMRAQPLLVVMRCMYATVKTNIGVECTMRGGVYRAIDAQSWRVIECGIHHLR